MIPPHRATDLRVMGFMPSTPAHVAVAVSWLVALMLVWRLLKSGEHPFLKIILSLIALVPFFGPILVLWLSDFPDPQPPALRSRYRYSSDVFDRWRHVFEEKNPYAKFRKWKKTISSTDNRGDFHP